MTVVGPFKGEYAFLSNFYPAQVEYDNIVYPTVEHAFQSAKTTSKEDRYRIAALSTPGQAKQAGKQLQLRPNWESIKVPIMAELVYLKFANHPDLSRRLLATGDLYIEEVNQWGDTFWGTYKGRGENHLGQILMSVRDELREKNNKFVGTLYFASIKELKQVTGNVKLFISRPRPRGLPEEWIHVSQMAPSEKLFRQYRAWVQDGKWPTMWPEYKQQFTQEMPAMQRFLDRVEEHLKVGRNVVLACYCQDLRYCHRSILGHYFQNRDFPVITV